LYNSYALRTKSSVIAPTFFASVKNLLLRKEAFC
jgi:hypothetical protein